jgi:DNA-binding MarR family transcriptional regulator
MAVSLTDAELRAWQAFLHAHEKVTRALDAELRSEHSLSMGKYDVLLRLARAPQRTLTMSELASRVLMSPSGLTRMVDQLVGAGLVSRRRSSEDGRVMLVTITEKGRAELRAAARTHVRGIKQYFVTPLSSVQLRDVARSLERIAGPHEPH